MEKLSHKKNVNVYFNGDWRKMTNMISYILIGTGNRMVGMFLNPIIERFSTNNKIEAVFDINIKRAQYVSEIIPYEVKTFDDVDKMFNEVEADACIIATNDNNHMNYINKALQHKMRVICEKPVVVTREQCNMLNSLSDEEKRKIIVTFNSRYMPVNSKIKQIIDNNCLGKIYNVQYHYCVDDSHSAEYFRRWHRFKKNSGTLLIHKSVHHFDLVNWWLNAKPVSVIADGCLIKYGGDESKNNQICRKCRKNCQYKLDDEKIESLSELYFNNEDIDGYYRDGCVWDDSIDIYDTMSVNVRYNNGVQMCYSLLLYSSYTGFYLKISGEKGQLIVDFDNSKDVNLIRLLGSNSQEIPVFSELEKKHNGADDILQELLFSNNEMVILPSVDEGIEAVLIGVAANESIENGKKINI